MSASAPLLPGWPARLQAPLAAAYVGLIGTDGQPDVETFRLHVKKGLYPAPYRRPGERQAWLKVELDEALGRIPGQTNDNDALD